MALTAKEMRKDLIQLGIRKHIADEFIEMVEIRCENTGESLEEAGRHIAKFLVGNNSSTIH